MAWYDVFSRFYDGSLEKLYREHREAAAATLDLREGLTVLDAGCGTGASFDAVMAQLGADGRIVGVDLSKGMLRRAQGRVEKAGWENVSLVQGSLLELDDAMLADERPEGGFDRALCFLVLTALDDWPSAFQRVWSQLKPGGRMVICDAHAERLGFQGRMVNLTARADIRREVWGELEKVAPDFNLERRDADWRIGGDMIVATGTRPK